MCGREKRDTCIYLCSLITRASSDEEEEEEENAWRDSHLQFKLGGWYNVNKSRCVCTCCEWLLLVQRGESSLSVINLMHFKCVNQLCELDIVIEIIEIDLKLYNMAQIIFNLSHEAVIYEHVKHYQHYVYTTGMAWLLLRGPFSFLPSSPQRSSPTGRTSGPRPDLPSTPLLPPCILSSHPLHFSVYKQRSTHPLRYRFKWSIMGSFFKAEISSWPIMLMVWSPQAQSERSEAS